MNSLSVAILSAFILASCSDGNSGSSSPDTVLPEARAEEAILGLYRANLEGLNLFVSGHPEGSAMIKVDKTFSASVHITNSPSTVSHRQFIYDGARCPEARDDVNGDGYLDSSELITSSGRSYIPLDNDLRGRVAGGKYPIANTDGDYLYNQSALLAALIGDLPTPEGLNLEGKLIVIQSISRTHQFPPTVSNENGDAHRTLPIACGVLTRVDDAWPWNTSFNTRLSQELLISGQRCTGTDECPEGQWSVIVDNLNRCSPEGQCTEIAVDPVLTELRKANVTSVATQVFYNLIPLGQVSEQQAIIMSKHWVRFDLNGDPIVLEK